MQRTALHVISIFFFGTFLAVFAQQPNACSTTCSGLSSKFKYKKGSSYTYKYDSDTKVQLVGNSKNVATVGLQAKAQISVIDTCEFVLSISDVKLSGPSAALVGFNLAGDLEKFSLAFSFDNGAIRNICPSAEDSVDALNIKRGILSSFQVANDFDAENAYESDIGGHCPARQTKEESSDAVSLTKIKNVLECRNHMSFYTSVRMVPYNVRSHIQNSPGMKANQECKLKIQGNVLKESICTESHQYLPFRNEKSGAGITATVSSKLIFAQEGKAAAPANVGKSESLLFDDRKVIWKESKESLAKAKETLAILCKTASKDVRPDTASHFIELVHELKTTSLEDLRSLVKEIKSQTAACPKFRNFVLDAVSQCGMTPCVSLATELLTAKSGAGLPNLTPLEEKFLLVNLAVTAHPTKPMIAAVTKVLSDLPQNGLFSATALVNNYCRLHPNCEDKAEVKAFAQKYLGLVSKLKLLEAAVDNTKAIETLRAFGNLGYLSDGIKERLSLLDHKGHIDAKLAAIQSLRRAPCTSEMEEKLFVVYSNNREFVEVRINAFLVLMNQCANKGLISRIVNGTDDINSNQVGSFVQTYFASARDSSDPSKNKHVFSRARLAKKFPSDPRKHSRFFGYSNFNHNYNFGYHADASVIFTPQGTSPKQATLNLTIDHFGKEVNLLELGVRVENMDEIIDSFFGPEGYLTNPGAAYDKEGRKIEIKNAKLAQFQQAFNKERKIPTGIVGLDLGGYIRVFGDELCHSSGYNIPVLDRLQRLLKPETIVNALSKEKTHNLAVHRLPFDHHATIPIISGFPLRFDVNTSVVVSIDLTTLLDVGDIPNGNAQAKFTLKPSANVESAILFGIYTGTVKNGVRYARSSHTSTELSFVMKLSNMNTLTAKFELPKERQELAKVESHITTIINDVPIEEKGVTTDRGEGAVCSPKLLSERIGLKLCTKISYPNASSVPDAPYFPLTGPFDAEIYVDKVDKSLTSYELSASWKASKVGRDVVFSFDTPKTKFNRKISLTAKYERQKSIDLEYKSPKRMITAKGTLAGAGPDNTAAILNVGVDGSVYEVKADIIRSALPDNGRKYAFNGNVKSASKPSVGELKGALELVPGRKTSLDAEVTKLFDKPLTYKGRYEKSTGKYGIEHDLRGPWGYRRLQGDVNLRSFADLDYSFNFEKQRLPEDQVPHKLSYSHNHSFKRAGTSAYELISAGKIACSKYPAMSGGYDLNINKKPEKFSLKLNTIEGSEPGLTYEQVTAIKPRDYSTTILFKYPKAKVNNKALLTYRNSFPTEFEASAKLYELDTKKEIHAVASMKKEPSTTVGDYLLQLKLPQGEYKMSKSVKALAAQKLEDITLVSWPPNKKLEITSLVTGEVGKEFEVKSVIKGTDMDPLDYAETYKILPNGGKWAGILKKAGKVLFDASADVTFDVAKKALKGRLQMPDQKVDVGIDGFVEKSPAGNRIFVLSKKNNKDFSKFDLSAPDALKLDQNKEVKIISNWDLDTAAPKEISFDAKTQASGKAVETEINWKIDTPTANYKFELKQRQNEHKATNFTIYKKDAPILKTSIGTLSKKAGPSGEKGLLDVYVQTFAPMEPRDFSGRLNYEFDGAKYKSSMLLTNKKDNSKLGLEAEAAYVKGGYDKSIVLTLDDKELRAKNFVSLGDVDAQLKGQLSLSDKSKKDQTFKWDIKKDATKIDVAIETPIPNYEKITFKGVKDQQEKKRTRQIELGWANNKIKADSLSEFEIQGSDISYSKNKLSLDTPFSALKTLSYELSQDYRKGLNAEFKLDVNKLHKFGANYGRTTDSTGDEKWTTGLACKLGATVDWETSSSAKWNVASGKYVTNNLVKTGANVQYKADLDLDSKTMEAKVNLVNVPGIQGPIKGKAKKIAENEYEVALLDSAGANQGKISFKLTTPAQKLRLETLAFKAGVETEYSDKKWSISGDVVPDAKTNKAYSILLSAENPDQHTRHSSLQVGYPERKLGFVSKRTKRPDGFLQHSLEINPNVGKREPTKLDISANRDKNSASGELHLLDPALPSGFHIKSKYALEPSSSVEISLKYSADPKKELLIKKSSKREILENREKISSSYEINHEASNLKHKIWHHLLLQPCAPNVDNCERSIEAGTQFPGEKGENLEYSIDVKHSEKSFDLSAGVGKDKYKLNRKKAVEGQRIYEVSKNGKPLYNIVTQLNKGPQPIALISIEKQPESTVIFLAEASLGNGELGTLKLNHDENGKLVKDVEVSLWLKESDRIGLKVFKRKELTKALSDLVKKYSQPKAPSANDLPAVVKTHQAISLDIVKELKPLFDAWDKEEDAISAELQISPGKLSQVFAGQTEELTGVINYLANFYDSNLRDVGKGARKLAENYKDAVKNAIYSLPATTEAVGPALRDARQQAADRLARIQARFETLWNDINKHEKVQDLVKAIMKLYHDLTQGSTGQRLKNLYEDAKKRLSEEGEGRGIAGQTLNDLQAVRNERFKQLSQIWQQIRAEWSKNEDYKELVDFFDAANAKLQWALQYADLHTKGRDTWNYIQSLTERGKEPPYMFNKSADGQTYNLELDLPEHYNSLPDLFCSLAPDRLIGHLQDAKESIEDALDTIYGGSGDSDDLFGAKESTALVIGDQTFVTFDGEVRTFAADCSYLLARDFKDSRFSVSVEFERSIRKKIVVDYDNQKVEILIDGKVIIDGKNTDLPLHILDSSGSFILKVHRHDEYYTSLESFDGLKIECNSYNNICAIKLKNRFRGKTNGLLGRNDGESYTDLSLPDGNPAQNLDDFASSWALNPSCAKKPNAAVTKILSADHKAYKECVSLFGGARSSPFRRCSNIKSEAFLNLCLQNLNQFVEKEKNESKHSLGVCQVAAAYLLACPQSTDLPAQCIECDIPGGKLNLHETKQISGTLLKDVDVVFAVELRDCMSSVQGKLASLAIKIDANLKKAGLNAKFGLAGFSGQGAFYEPSFFSSQQKLVSFSAAGIKVAADRLQFIDPERIKTSPYNPLDIIDFIIEHYSFKPASRKIVVLFSCKSCVTLELDYYNLHTKLLGQGYSLHLVTNQKIELSGSSALEKFIGFDASSFIKLDLLANIGARKDLIEPHDSCTVLAQETNGSVYSIADKLHISKVFDSLASSITKTAQGNACNVCECQIHDLYPKSVCFACEVPQPAPVTADQTGFFNNPFQKLAKFKNKE